MNIIAVLEFNKEKQMLEKNILKNQILQGVEKLKKIKRKNFEMY